MHTALLDEISDNLEKYVSVVSMDHLSIGLFMNTMIHKYII